MNHSCKLKDIYFLNLTFIYFRVMIMKIYQFIWLRIKYDTSVHWRITVCDWCDLVRDNNTHVLRAPCAVRRAPCALQQQWSAVGARCVGAAAVSRTPSQRDAASRRPSIAGVCWLLFISYAPGISSNAAANDGAIVRNRRRFQSP